MVKVRFYSCKIYLPTIKGQEFLEEARCFKSLRGEKFGSNRSVKLGVAMDLPVSSPSRIMASAIQEAVGHTQPHIVTELTTTTSAKPANSYRPSVTSLQTPSLISALNMSSSKEIEEEMRSISGNMGMHIRPAVPIAANEESSNTIFLEQEALSGSYSVGLHSMERTPMISSGVAPSLPVAQSVLSSAQASVMSMAPLMPLNGSYSQNSGCDIWQLQGGPNVGQPVPALNQSTLPGTQTGHGRPSANQNASSMLSIPDLSRPMTRMQTRVINNTTVNTQMGHSGPSTNQNSSNRMPIYDLSRTISRMQPRVINNTTVNTQMGHSSPSTNQNSISMPTIPDLSRPMTRVQPRVINNVNTQMGLIGPSTNQNSSNRLAIPDSSRPMTRMQPRVINNTTVNTQMGHSGLSTNQNSSNRLAMPALSRSITRMQPRVINNTTVNTQMGHSGPSTNESSSNRLAIPDLSRPTTGMQPRVINNTTVSRPRSQPRVTASSSEFSIIYEGGLYMRSEGQLGLITTIEGFRRAGTTEVFSFDWPRGLQILRLFHFNRSCYRNCTEIAGFIVFRAMRDNLYLRHMRAYGYCAVIELTWDMIFLIVIDEVHLVGLRCPRNSSERLERMLQGVPQEHPNNQQQLMELLLRQDPHVFQIQMRWPRGSGPPEGGRARRIISGIYTQLYRQQMSRYQQQHVLEIQNRQRLQESPEQQILRQAFLNQLERQPLFADPRLQQQERQQRLLEEAQQQGQQQEQLHQEQHVGWAGQPPFVGPQSQHQVHQQFPGPLLQQGREQALNNNLQQQERQQQELHQEQRIGWAGQPPFVGPQSEHWVQQQLPGQLLQQGRDQAPNHNLQQQERQQQLHQERHIGLARQPTLISEFEWFRRVLNSIWPD